MCLGNLSCLFAELAASRQFTDFCRETVPEIITTEAARKSQPGQRNFSL
jgi:hypothetical protein